MKKLVLVLIALASAQSFAGTCAVTNGLYADFPKIAFGSVFVSVDGLCVKGETLFTQSAISVCTEWKGNEVDACSKYENKVLSTSVQYSKEIPSGETSFTTITGNYPLSYSVPVGVYGETFQTVCELAYTIPACK